MVSTYYEGIPRVQSHLESASRSYCSFSVDQTCLFDAEGLEPEFPDSDFAFMPETVKPLKGCQQ